MYAGKTLAVFSPPPGTHDNPEDSWRAQYLRTWLEAIQSERISTPVLPPEIEQDNMGHPTEEGTGIYLTFTFTNDAFMVAGKLYGGVQSVYCYGCRTCGKMGQFPGKLGICHTCHEEMGRYDWEERWTNFVASLPPPLCFRPLSFRHRSTPKIEGAKRWCCGEVAPRGKTAQKFT